jgi:hypothetical protein
MNKTIKKSFYLLSIISVAFLVSIMLGLIVFKQQIFIEKDIISTVDIFIAMGFGVFVVFNIFSVILLYKQLKDEAKTTTSNKLILALGILCLILLIGEKTMADEIGREYSLGWETLGEWIILYVFLAIQLFYNFRIIKILKNNTSHNKVYEVQEKVR